MIDSLINEFKKELKEAMVETVKDAIKLNESTNKPEEELLTRLEACAFLKINSSTLWDWTRKGKIPCFGISNRRYYKKQDLFKSLTQLKVN